MRQHLIVSIQPLQSKALFSPCSDVANDEDMFERQWRTAHEPIVGLHFTEITCVKNLGVPVTSA